MKKIKKNRERFIGKYCGYGSGDSRPGSHILLTGNKDVCLTLTTLCSFNMVVVEIYEDDESSDSEGLW